MMNKVAAICVSAGLLAIAGCADLMGSSQPTAALTPADNYPVFFQHESAAIDANGTSTIAIAAKAALAHPTYPVIVTGSADTSVAQVTGQEVSLARAQAVAAALVADGVAQSRIGIVSTGSLSSPGVSAGSAAQFSRRVLIKVGN